MAEKFSRHFSRIAYITYQEREAFRDENPNETTQENALRKDENELIQQATVNILQFFFGGGRRKIIKHTFMRLFLHAVPTHITY